METLLLIEIIITGLFFAVLGIKELIPKKNICAICFAVALTWIALLVLFWKKMFSDPILIALLMGQSIIGLFYLWENYVNEKWLLFRLPFLLTITTLGYLSITGSINTSLLLFLGILWLIFSFMYASKQNKKINSMVKKVIQCCKKW